jgi:hypothetical protein
MRIIIARGSGRVRVRAQAPDARNRMVGRRGRRGCGDVGRRRLQHGVRPRLEDVPAADHEPGVAEHLPELKLEADYISFDLMDADLGRVLSILKQEDPNASNYDFLPVHGHAFTRLGRLAPRFELRRARQLRR